MNARYVILADDAYTGESGKLYADGIFEEIYARKFPVTHKRLVIAVRFEGTKNETGKHRCNIILYDQKNRPLFKTETLEFELGGKNQVGPIFRAGVITTIRNITLKRAGNYRFSILVDGRFVTRVAFTVRKEQIIPSNQIADA